MAFASVGTLGHTSLDTASQTLSMSPGSTVPVGHLIVVWASWRGDGSYSDAAGKNETSLACTDSVGNIYTELQGALFDAEDGLYMTYVDVPLTTSDTITLTHRSTTIKAKAISAWEFTLADNMRPAIWRDSLSSLENSSSIASESAQPGAITVGSLDSGTEYLMLHILANARPVSDSYTWDADYTQVDSDGTSSLSPSYENTTLRGGYRIISGITSDTVDVNDDTHGTIDVWQGFIAISEVAYDSVFPTFPNFDDFNRANEDPLATPPWSASNTDLPGQGTAKCRVDSNECARSASGTFHGAQYWDATIPAGDDGEVFVTITNTGATTSHQGAHCFATGSGQNATLGGYAEYWIGLTGARSDYLNYGDSGNTGGDCAGDYVTVWIDKSTGCKMGLQMRNSGVVIHFWADIGSGWRWVSAFYRTAFVTNGGKFGLNFANDSVARMDDFGGGTSIPGGPQIYRRVFG